ncbi:MAG: PKD domain-containing protein, partial [Candidatus Thermoplasmatota archaeon]
MREKKLMTLIISLLISFSIILYIKEFTTAEPPPPNLPPIANAGGNQTVYRNETVILNASLSVDYDGYIVNYSWDFDASDGVNFTDAYGIEVTTSYNMVGNYTVTLRVRDNMGGEDTDTCIITVIARPPISNPGGPYYINEGEVVNLNASGSYDPDGSIVN